MAISRLPLVRRFFGSAVSNAAGYSVGGAIQPTLEPLTQDLANETWRLHSTRPLPAGEAAAADVAGLDLPDGAEDEAAFTGINADRFRALRVLAANPPTLDEALQLWRRGELTEDEVAEAQAQSIVLPRWRAPLRKLRDVVPSVTDMVRFAVREVYNPAQRDFLDLDAEFPAAFADDAENIGLTRERAGQYWAAHWELPSYTQGVQMFFRGEITRAQLDALLKAQDYAPTWRGKLLAIAEAIPALQDMIRFAVREVYDPAKRRALQLDEDFPEAFARQAALHGMSEEHAREYWAAHWRLPSPEQGFRMLHRDLIDIPELDALLKADDYAPKYRRHLRDIAYLVPGRIDLRRMYAAGVIDRARVKRGYLDIGYTEHDAELLTQFAVKLAGTGSETDSHIGKAKTQLWGTTHTSYKAGEADEARARENMTALDIDAADQDAILELWNLERATVRKQLTLAQVKTAYRDALMSRDEVTEELLGRGYSLADVTILLGEWDAA